MKTIKLKNVKNLTIHCDGDVTVEMHNCASQKKDHASQKKQPQEHFTFDEAQEAVKGKPFRLPTKQEFQNLLKNEHFFKDGKLFVLSGSRCIAFSAKGYRNYSNGSLRHSGDCGYYWSSSSNSQSTRWGLNFTSSYAGCDFDGKDYGFALRCVSDSPLEGFIKIGNLYWATENYSK
ncbi:MAG: fibrobacter succinogenes major paralogous domain-containing protein [Dysgonamonadaceae bacterium]|jgi:uncharacterized protein (TIGR02145 family)|nr:fibrobacter succinogenes major paralogous domain-containing protein [Dysgonamonadaceae bacterium]